MSLLLHESPSAQRPRSAAPGLGHGIDRCRYLSDLLARLERDGHQDPLLDQAKWLLYCANYHATAVDHPATSPRNSEAIRSFQRNLNQAENSLGQFLGVDTGRASAWATDLDADSELEVRLQNQHFLAWLAPAAGGRLLSLDLLSSFFNVLAIGLPSFIEEFYRTTPPHDPVKTAWFTEPLAPDLGLAALPFHGQIRRGIDRLQILLKQQREVQGIPLRFSKSLAIRGRSSTVDMAYLIEGLPAGFHCHFASLWHFPQYASSVADRVLHDCGGHHLPCLEEPLRSTQAQGFGLTDHWLGLDLRLSFAHPADVVILPRGTPHCPDSVRPLPPAIAVMPCWSVRGDVDGRWCTRLKLSVNATRHSVSQRGFGLRRLPST
jgi:hypothetical protein